MDIGDQLAVLTLVGTLCGWLARMIRQRVTNRRERAQRELAVADGTTPPQHHIMIIVVAQSSGRAGGPTRAEQAGQ